MRVESGSVPEPGMEQRLKMREEPQQAPVMFQTWSNLLFLHWEWDPTEIQKTLPPGLFVDTYGGKAYLGVIPFFISDIRASFLPPIPGATEFLELNVRTYVYDRQGRPGVWFYSLDCNHRLAAWMAKIFYGLPYKTALMSAKDHAGVTEYTCLRASAGEEFASRYHYRALQERLPTQPGTLPFFLIERYLLFAYSTPAEKLYSARVYHSPYEVFQAHLGRCDEHMLELNGFKLALRQPDHVAITPEALRVKIYSLEALES